MNNNFQKFIDILQEKTNDYNLYHITNTDSLISILKTGMIEPMYDKISGYGISLTRYKKLDWNGNVILVFDKNELSTRYKIKPIHWFNQRHDKEYRMYGDKAKPYTNQNIPVNQYEERIITENPIPINFIKEIKLKKPNVYMLRKVKKLTTIPIHTMED